MSGRTSARAWTLALLLVLAAAGGCGGDEGEDSPTRGEAPPGERTQLSGASIDKTIRLPGQGTGEDVAVGEGAVWVLLSADLVARVDPARGGIKTAELSAGITRSVAVGRGTVWVADVQRRTVIPVDAETLRQGDPIKVGRPSTSLLFGPLVVAHGRVWVADWDQRALWTIDPATKRVDRDPIKLESPASDLAADPDGLWAAIDGDAVRVDPRTRRVTKEVFTGVSADGMAFGEGALWLIDTGEGSGLRSVEKVDPNSTDTQRLDVPTAEISGASDVEAAFGGVWATDLDEDEVVLLNPRDLERLSSVRLRRPSAMAVDRESVWVSASGQRALVRLVPKTDG